MSAAGLHGLHIGGLTADTPNIAGLKNGTEDVWTAYSLPIVAYRQIDSMARKFEGMPTLNAALPTQLMTPQNVNSLVVDSRATTSAWPTTALSSRRSGTSAANAERRGAPSGRL